MLPDDIKYRKYYSLHPVCNCLFSGEAKSTIPLVFDHSFFLFSPLYVLSKSCALSPKPSSIFVTNPHSSRSTGRTISQSRFVSKGSGGLGLRLFEHCEINLIILFGLYWAVELILCFFVLVPCHFFIILFRPHGICFRSSPSVLANSDSSLSVSLFFYSFLIPLCLPLILRNLAFLLLLNIWNAHSIECVFTSSLCIASGTGIES